LDYRSRYLCILQDIYDPELKYITLSYISSEYNNGYKVVNKAELNINKKGYSQPALKKLVMTNVTNKLWSYQSLKMTCIFLLFQHEFCSTFKKILLGKQWHAFLFYFYFSIFPSKLLFLIVKEKNYILVFYVTKRFFKINKLSIATIFSLFVKYIC